MLPEADVATIHEFCARRVSPDASDQMRLETVVDAVAVTIFERRAPWMGGGSQEWSTLAIARLRYTAASGVWTLHYPDRNERWRKYDGLAPSARVVALLEEIDRDPTGIFWG